MRSSRGAATRCGAGLRAVLPLLLLVALAAGAHGAHAQTPSPSSAQASAAASARPRVRLIATGGTISNRQGGRLSAAELVALVPQAAAHAEIDVEQFSNVASGQLSLAQWLELARRLDDILRGDPGLAGIVVTCGTDTLEELAYFLHLTVRSDRPVVVVGSMRRPDTPGYDGTANLLAAFRVAASNESRGRGVLVVLNDEIHSAREVTKSDAQRLHTFQSRGYGLLGVVDADRVVYYRSPVKRHTARSEFDVHAIASLPRVDVLLTYQAAPGDLIRAAVDAGARGIVLATAAGGTSGTQMEGVRYALDRGATVVLTTRTGAGRIAPLQAARLNPNGRGQQSGSTVAGEDLTPIKARILLMLALTKTRDASEVQRMFTEY